MPPRPDQLYELLPSALRDRDRGEGEPLRALAALLQASLEALEDDVESLGRDWFIETCDEWVVPYLGDLVAADGMHGDRRGLPSLRPVVGNALRRRRAKGTPAMIEAAARELTGWEVRVVALADRLLATPHLHHPRGRGGTPDLRRARPGRLGDPFDATPRSAGLGGGHARDARPNAPRVALHVWTLQSRRLARVPLGAPHGGPAYARTISPLGDAQPLFVRRRRERRDRGPASAAEAPGPIDPVDLARDLDAARATGDSSACYGPEGSFVLLRGATPVPAREIVVADLAAWRPAPPGMIAVDPRSGRLAFGEGQDPRGVEASFSLGHVGDVGGDPRRRGPEAPADRVVRVGAAASPDRVAAPSLGEALALALAEGEGRRVAVELADDAVHELPARFEVPARSAVEVRAAPGRRPTLLPTEGTAAEAPGAFEVVGGEGSGFALRGVHLAGATVRLSGALASFDLADATLVPGLLPGPLGEPRFPEAPSLVSAPAQRPRVVRLLRAVTGPLALDPALQALEARGAILDGMPDLRRGPALAGLDGPGPDARLEECTVMGGAHLRSVLARACVFAGPLRVLAPLMGHAEGCLLAEGSEPPVRLDGCLGPGPGPDGRPVRPTFAASRWGRPDHADLSPEDASALRGLGGDGAEPGAYAGLRRPARMSILAAALDDLLPAGLAARIIRVT